ncbi:MAG: hypothetical protein V4505_00645 [Pseudomonadota bacterium]
MQSPNSTDIDADLPDALRVQMHGDAEMRQKQLDGISLLIARKREEAVAGRRQSGIEDIWTEDEEAYEGIDDANRGEVRSMKPASSQGGLQPAAPRRGAGATRSTIFLRITTQYVDSAAARVGDMLLPTDDRAFEIRPVPMPELTKLKGDATPVAGGGGVPMAPPAGVPGVGGDLPVMPGAPAAPQTVGDLAQQALDVAAESAKKAERRIDDWLVECQFHAEKRKAIHDRARLGVGVMKGPFPVRRKARLAVQEGAGDAGAGAGIGGMGGGGAGLVVREEIQPASRRIDPWNLFPDPACGEDIHSGNYLLERDWLTDKQLRALVGVPGYLDAQIDGCLEEGPQKAFLGAQRSGGSMGPGTERADQARYEIWYYYGELRVDDLRACGCTVEEDAGGDAAGSGGDAGVTRPALVTLVNDRVIKAALNTLDSGGFPYDATPWQGRTGHWAGIGVARQCREAQGGINAAVRNMLDNAALSGGPILAIDRNLLQPADESWVLTPRKIFYTKEGEDGGNVAQAIHAFDIPSRQAELMQIIDFFLKMAEQTTGMPMLLQGQTGAAPDTLGGQLLANNNASTVLRRIARLDDDYSTEPHVRRYYEYLMLYGEDDSEKGSFTVDARGSSALVERDIQNHATVQMLALSTNPAFGVDPKKAFAEACKAQRLDPKRFQYSEDELAKMALTPPAPPVQVAQIRSDSLVKAAQVRAGDGADGAAGATAVVGAPGGPGAPSVPAGPDVAVQVAHIRQGTELGKAQMAQQLDMEALRLKADEAERDRQHQREMKRFEYEMALMKFAQEERMQLSEVQSTLADTAMRLDVQKQLSAAALAVDVHKHHSPASAMVRQVVDGGQAATPPTEPAGRAQPGQAFVA